MLCKLYNMATPWATANKIEITMNRLLGVVANVMYPIYCSINDIKKLNKPDQKPKIIVSLTSFPPRIKKLNLCIESILRQTVQADEVILWLATSQFPEGVKNLPSNLIRLQKKGLTIRFCDDIKSFKKVFYTAQQMVSDIIITADDDTLYPEDWIKGLYNEYKLNTKCVVCYRAHQMTFNSDGQLRSYSNWNGMSPGIKGPLLSLVPIGVGGVLYPPYFFEEVNFDIEIIRKLCLTTDDLWLKCIGLKKGYPIVKVKKNTIEWFTIRNSQKESLVHKNVNNIATSLNDIALQNLADYYQIEWQNVK